MKIRLVACTNGIRRITVATWCAYYPIRFFFGAFVIEEKRTSFQVNPYNAGYRIGTKTSLHLDT